MSHRTRPAVEHAWRQVADAGLIEIGSAGINIGYESVSGTSLAPRPQESVSSSAPESAACLSGRILCASE